MPNDASAVRDHRYSIVMRRYPRINGPAALPLFCLAPHGVFPASRIAPRAVSSYLAFSTLPVPLLPKNRRCLFCDTFRHRNFTTAAPAYFTRHVAVWCSDFPPASHCGSPAIICHRTEFNTIRNAGKQEQDSSLSFSDFLASYLPQLKMAAARS
jgi:hypothetical protein